MGIGLNANASQAATLAGFAFAIATAAAGPNLTPIEAGWARDKRRIARWELERTDTARNDKDQLKGEMFIGPVLKQRAVYTTEGGVYETAPNATEAIAVAVKMQQNTYLTQTCPTTTPLVYTRVGVRNTPPQVVYTTNPIEHALNKIRRVWHTKVLRPR